MVASNVARQRLLEIPPTSDTIRRAGSVPDVTSSDNVACQHTSLTSILLGLIPVYSRTWWLPSSGVKLRQTRTQHYLHISSGWAGWPYDAG